MLQILLDCDGVLADFLTPALKKLNKATGKKLTIEDYVKFQSHQMEKPFGITKKEFWRIIEEEDVFWGNLKPFPWAQKLLNYCETLGDVTICTSPSRNPMCALQKTQWLLEHLNIHNDRLMLGKRKELLARPDHLLVDDSPDNVQKFKHNNGRAVLVPSNWNTLDLTFEKVKAQIELERRPDSFYGF